MIVQFMYSSCTVYVQFMYSSGHKKKYWVYSPCTVHIQYIHDQDYSKEEQQAHPPSQLKWL